MFDTEGREWGKSQKTHNPKPGRQDHVTPREFITATSLQWGTDFQVDLAGSLENKRADLVLTADQDSLSVDWGEYVDPTRWGWLNPPFGNTGAFMEKCATEAKKGVRIASLVLASFGSAWYMQHIRPSPHALVLQLTDRLTFEGEPNPFPKELMLILWQQGVSGVGHWAWQKNKKARRWW